MSSHSTLLPHKSMLPLNIQTTPETLAKHMGRSRRSFLLLRRTQHLQEMIKKKSIRNPFECPECTKRSLWVVRRKLDDRYYAVCRTCGKSWPVPEGKVFEPIDLYHRFLDAFRTHTLGQSTEVQLINIQRPS